ncbi:Uncharacterized protein dnl_29390 [Desulfonema limicola]|uniref:Uncharacterized protein n=1 Tax=Desulfonema limicola TaxID=45656 RepID=A0A975B868_9BACT|nr:hypothetical protein [Desulfonema limicola]QTA80628.1 Uncharacterized protein dnl_29390 [Desulfonema limicola]
MQAIEFESKSYKGVIEIPIIHKDWYDRAVKVILLRKTESEISDEDTDKLELMRFFDRFNADLTGYQFDRDDANER